MLMKKTASNWNLRRRRKHKKKQKLRRLIQTLPEKSRKMIIRRQVQKERLNFNPSYKNEDRRLSLGICIKTRASRPDPDKIIKTPG